MKNIQELAAKKEITYKDAQTASQEIGKILSEAYGDELTAEILPNGRMYYNIASRIVRPTMEQAYFDIADITELTQNVLNEEAGIGIKAIRPNLKQDKIDGIVERLAEAEKFEDVAWMLQAPINTFCQSIVDDAVQANAEFQYKSGMQPKIIRRTAGNCCEWCSRLAGTYSYPNVPKDVYRRHNNCNCTVEFYTAEGKRQDIWSKRWREDESILEPRRKIGLDYSHKLNPEKLEADVDRKNNTSIENVLTNYLRNARPGEGIITYDKIYDRTTHRREIETAKWIHDNLGGDIEVLQEIGLPNQQTPDYIWKGKYWELKNPTTEKSADSALRKGLHQIKGNPGGIILDYGNNEISYEALMNIISRRLIRQDCEADVLVLNFNELIKAVRYRK